MRKYFLYLTVIVLSEMACAQNGYYTLFVQQDTAIQWAAECDKIINLTPKVNEYSLKKWYLEKLRTDSITAYSKKKGSSFISPYKLSMPGLKTQEWLAGLTIEPIARKSGQSWRFLDWRDKSWMPFEDRIKYLGGRLYLNADSCCGCDEADAFRVKQIIYYKEGKFSIYNPFISPLCARIVVEKLIEWYPLCNVAYNDDYKRQVPALSNNLILLNTDEVYYNFSSYHRYERKDFDVDSILTSYRKTFGEIIYQEILDGKLKARDPETNKIIPSEKFLSWRIPVDTFPIYDTLPPHKIIKYVTSDSKRDPKSDFNHALIKQDLYFDFINQRLYSVVRSVTIGYKYSVKGVEEFKPYYILQ